MHITPFDQLICRTPAFPQDQTLQDAWERLKEKIKSSSSTFYPLIKELTFKDLSHKEEKLRFTVWKYFNRAKFRATPFSSFAAFSIIPLLNQPNPISLKEKLVVTRLTDWIHKEDLITELPKLLAKSSLITANSSLYQLNNELRYISHSEQGFNLSTVASFPILQAVLDSCREQVELMTIYDLLEKEYRLSKKESTRLLVELIGQQLVVVDGLPNIIGQDYFSRHSYDPIGQETFYELTQRDVHSGGIDGKVLDQVPEWINFLNLIEPYQESQTLEQFRQEFVKKFGQAQVPLSIATDPETGIVYDDLVAASNDSELLKKLNLQLPKGQDQQSIPYSHFQIFLLEQMLSKRSIHLEQFKPTESSSPINLPNSFSVVFKRYEENLIIEQIGGATANALLGRFTHSSLGIGVLTRKIVELEHRSNPGVIFFDIGYQSETKVDNINRRQHIYHTELPINSWSTAKQVLRIDRILIQVIDNQLILHDSHSGLRLVPRLASAYNYTRSDLAIYRLLCDLQYQNLRASLHFELWSHLPGLTHYPRTYFKKIIVSPARWLIPSFLKQKSLASSPQSELALRQWLDQHQLPVLVQVSEGDLTLLFNTTNSNELWALSMYIRQHQQDQIYLIEGLLDENNAVKDENEHCYQAQYIVNYFHDQQLYRPYTTDTPPVFSLPKEKDLLLPGEYWLYLEIYGHHSRGNEFLIEFVRKITAKHRAILRHWFFIRYDNPSAHLRIRLAYRQKDDFYTLTDAFSTALKPKIMESKASDFIIRSYFRESQRYGPDRIELVEAFFHLDSKLVIRILARNPVEEQLYTYGLIFMRQLIQLLPNGPNQQLNLVKRMAESFAREMNFNKATFKTINQAYLRCRGIQISPPPFSAQKKIMLRILNRCIQQSEGEQLVADLIHMHINRLFQSNQRLHEAILYQYLWKDLQSNKVRSDQGKRG
ncbi:MAG: thiopeptide-type bacteriocin biosynthesis protein [Bacteroidota bacterium]